MSEDTAVKANFYGLLVRINGAWLKRLVIGVHVAEPDGLRRILAVLKRLHQEFPNCPWQEFRVVRINLETEQRLQDWRDTVRGQYMIVNLDTFEKFVYALFGTFA